ncbi:hypothetical protein BU24DRAFT_492153 [Aaosphaeria arxii CBS 175.79]|uniref:Nucleolar protein Dnt1-like N-terminal domain-containing protein n=1 Tax=Aaosphaeria arxii CBS 175.79 TaxID=1450172 RepID=A0A6A5XUQ5_9PLEO|nr:uncharacterized protein BU24DRAFT_492153 [Aaosphaeria arxii CBS 175.79]KAF2015974.1 hypothetical protein BU24DRAFT_492153 [Aaosphaeria arxii CBS 175.79]
MAASAASRMRLTIDVLPLTEENSHAPREYRELAVAALKGRRFALPVQSEQTLEEVWAQIEERYKRNYLQPHEAVHFTILKLQDAYECDLDLSDTVASIYEGETDPQKRLIRVVPSFTYRDFSVPISSNLRPISAQKRHRDAHEEQSNKRRRVDGHYNDEIIQDRPILSTESDNGALGARDPSPLGQSQRSKSSASVIYVQNSQTGEAIFPPAIKEESPELGVPTTRSENTVDQAASARRATSVISEITSQQDANANGPLTPPSNNEETVQHSSSPELFLRPTRPVITYGSRRNIRTVDSAQKSSQPQKKTYDKSAISKTPNTRGKSFKIPMSFDDEIVSTPQSAQRQRSSMNDQSSEPEVQREDSVSSSVLLSGSPKRPSPGKGEISGRVNGQSSGSAVSNSHNDNNASRGVQVVIPSRASAVNTQKSEPQRPHRPVPKNARKVSGEDQLSTNGSLLSSQVTLNDQLREVSPFYASKTLAMVHHNEDQRLDKVSTPKSSTKSSNKSSSKSIRSSGLPKPSKKYYEMAKPETPVKQQTPKQAASRATISFAADTPVAAKRPRGRPRGSKNKRDSDGVPVDISSTPASSWQTFMSTNMDADTSIAITPSKVLGGEQASQEMPPPGTSLAPKAEGFVFVQECPTSTPVQNMWQIGDSSNHVTPKSQTTRDSAPKAGRQSQVALSSPKQQKHRSTTPSQNKETVSPQLKNPMADDGKHTQRASIDSQSAKAQHRSIQIQVPENVRDQPTTEPRSDSTTAQGAMGIAQTFTPVNGLSSETQKTTTQETALDGSPAAVPSSPGNTVEDPMVVSSAESSYEDDENEEEDREHQVSTGSMRSDKVDSDIDQIMKEATVQEVAGGDNQESVTGKENSGETQNARTDANSAAPIARAPSWSFGTLTQSAEVDGKDKPLAYQPDASTRSTSTSASDLEAEEERENSPPESGVSSARSSPAASHQPARFLSRSPTPEQSEGEDESPEFTPAPEKTATAIEDQEESEESEDSDSRTSSSNSESEQDDSDEDETPAANPATNLPAIPPSSPPALPPHTARAKAGGATSAPTPPISSSQPLPLAARSAGTGVARSIPSSSQGTPHTPAARSSQLLNTARRTHQFPNIKQQLLAERSATKTAQKGKTFDPSSTSMGKLSNPNLKKRALAFSEDSDEDSSSDSSSSDSDDHGKGPEGAGCTIA